MKIIRKKYKNKRNKKEIKIKNKKIYKKIKITNQ